MEGKESGDGKESGVLPSDGGAGQTLPVLWQRQHVSNALKIRI